MLHIVVDGTLEIQFWWIWTCTGFDKKEHALKKKKMEYNLKKCAPMIRSRELVFSPTRLRSIVEVFVANMQWGGHTFSSSLNIFCLRGTFSMTACKNEFHLCHQYYIKIKKEKYEFYFGSEKNIDVRTIVIKQ